MRMQVWLADVPTSHARGVLQLLHNEYDYIRELFALAYYWMMRWLC